MVSEITTQIPPPPTGRPAPAMSIVPANNVNKPSNDVDRRQDQAALGKDMPAVDKDMPAVDKEKEAPATQQEMVEAVEVMQEYAQSLARDLDFKIDEDSGRTIITVIDAQTDEVVRQIPSEEVLNVINSLRKNGSLMTDMSA